MTNRQSFALIPIFLACLIFLAGIGYGQNITTETVIIEIDLARFVASEQVHRNNPPFEWLAVDHIVLHDIDGAVRAYAFLFAKSDTSFKTPEDLRRHILEKSALLSQAQAKAASAPPDSQTEGVTPKLVVEAEEALYAFNDLATVITGAVSDSPLILRHFRGIPEFWVQTETLNSSTSRRFYGKTLEVSSVIMITPMDFRLAASEGIQPGKAAATLRTAEKAALPATAQSINVHAKKVEPIEALRARRQAIEDRKQQRFNTLEPAERARYEQSLMKRARWLAEEWEQERETWQKAKDEGEVAR